jgi:large subunit ribosomal protein L28
MSDIITDHPDKSEFSLFTFSPIFDSIQRLYRVEGRIDMSRTCDICGKHTITGNKVSHAKNHTRRTWKPNLVKVKTELGGTAVTLKICARCLKSDYITKKV